MKPKHPAKFVGIDLGTTTSGLAYIRTDGNPEIVPNADGERMTPSVVYFDRSEDIKLVGSAARDGGDPDRTIHLIKRHMDNPNHVVTMDGKRWTPTEISALILAKLKRDCEKIIGPIEEVVITVPANFNELARKATIAAGRIAGFKVKRIVNEPTAAALYYAHSQGLQGKVLIYDLGGGTLDITVLEVSGETIRCLTSEGARRLGGSNFDDRILDLIAETYRDEHGVDLYENERQRRRCLQSGEDMKKMLSKLKQVTDTIGNERGGITRIELSRDVFEDAVGRLFTRTIMLVEQALDSVGLKPADIDHVALVGGSTRMPRIREMLHGFFGFEPTSCGNVDECVALGAALFAQKAAQVHEVCNHSYGTLAIVEDAATGDLKYGNSIVIQKNTAIPCSASQTYVTSEDNEANIEVEITQGEDTDPKYVDVIGKIQLEVPPGRPAGCEVTVTYSYDENQRVHATVKDERSGRVKDVAIAYQGAGVLGDEEIERKTAYFERLRIE
ncbi:MAG: Hsp70 family protein [Verrucomicrobiales bacterium]|nr:Hsp70 family protein [Verrucomicrobiales bacterium]